METENLQKSQGAEGASIAQEKTPETPENRPVAIRVKNLYKIYRVGESKVRALNGVDFELYKGEFVAIVGTSGSGKSTLLNMLAGLEKPTKGEIEIGKVHIEKLTERQLVTFRREKVGFIFQAYNLLNTMNAVENVALPLAFRGISKRERLKRAKRFMKLVGVGDQANHMPNQMSGGQQQRLCIARALAVQPDVILHLAALSDTGYCQQHPEESRRANVELPIWMAKAARDTGAKLISFSSDQVYAGVTQPGPLPETLPLSPANTYGQHKLKAEEQVLALCPEAVLLRAPWMYDLPGDGLPLRGNLPLNLLQAAQNGTPVRFSPHDHRGVSWVREVV